MSYVDSLISVRANEYAKANPEIALLVFGAVSRTITGLSEDTLTPAFMVACGVLASWDATEGTTTDTATEDRIMIAARKARSVIKAAIERDRDTNDGQNNGHLMDTSDPAFEYTYGTARNAFDTDSTTDENETLEARFGQGASVATNPAACTLNTTGDKIREAVAVAVTRFNAEPNIIEAIRKPDLGSTREREGFGPVARAAGLATSGRALAASKARVAATLEALTLAGTATLDRTSVIKIKGTWTDETLSLSDSLVSRPVYGAEATQVEIFPVVVTQGEFCGLSESAEQYNGLSKNGPTGTPAPRMLGVKVPSRRSGKRGTTGPTIPDQLRTEVETYFLIPTQASYRAETAGILAGLK